MRLPHALAALLVTIVAAGCASNRPGDLAPGLPVAGPVVLVKQVQIPDWEPWYARFAVHTWIDYRDADGRWQRVGVPGTTTDVVRKTLDEAEALGDERWKERVRVIDRVTGDRAARVVAQLEDAEARWTDGSYKPFPGPNSNTFIERVVRATDGLSTQLEPNAVGKDHASLRAGVTASGTGVELESAWLGAEIGLKEGVQLHLAQLPLGVRLWPPAILLPFAPAIGPRFAL
ncbi:MAG: DUF3750 domain-containing protein [Planctomycetota bacterium]